MSENEKNAAAPARRPAIPLLRGDLSEAAIVIAFIVIIAYLSLTTTTFLSGPNIASILVATALLGIVACGQTFVIITGGIDLSPGAVVALSGILAGLAVNAGVPTPLALGIGVLTGMVVGLFSGISVTLLRMNPFIVTLAAMSMARGLAFIIPNGATIFGFPDEFDAIGGGVVTLPFIGTIPIAGIISLAVLLIGAFVLRKTVFGSEVYAVGGNKDAAVLAGIPVQRTLILVYLISGGLAGLGGVLLAGKLDSAQPIAATGLELNTIAAVVIGGASLFGGRGSMFGTILGVLLIGVINNGLTLKNVEPFWVQFIQGAVIFVAVLLDSLGQRKRG